jgi:asparagine synthase (glutamine-hydrolysing)
VKVALSGDGGDELFGGYDRYCAMALGQRLGLAGRAMRKFAGLVPGSHPKSQSTRLRRLLTSLDLPPAQRYARYLMLFDPAMQLELLGQTGQDVIAERYEQLLASGRDVVQAALAVDREIYLPDDLLAKVDRCSMLHALEVRSPFMDEALVRFAANLPSDQLIRGGPKRLLRLAFAGDLPASVFSRKKMGFAVPIGEWFRGSLREMLLDHLPAANSFANSHFNMPAIHRLLDEHQASRVDHSQRLYALLMLELWWRQAAARTP